ncbi:clavesin-1 [Caerostris extrusa]|uniref:Clavesin-1 n=1 Tax=Caerostris extrusa TaxID=172846 RepID=A0AAV4QNI6_CAEEX|nr:clavesin-1 [Caerostris extrusa]
MNFLLQYLRVRKYNVARAFTQLKALVALKKKHPLIFTNFSYDIIVKSTYDKVTSILPWRCQDGCVILLVELGMRSRQLIPEKFPMEDVKRTYVLYLLESLRNPMTQINGFKIIYDLKSNPLRHLRHLTPENLYLLYHGTQARKIFRKGYHPGWTEEAFAIYKQYPANPPTCVLQDLSGKEIAGRFYAEELQKIDKTDKYFWAIENIIRPKGQDASRQLLVKWFGFDDSFNSWIKAEWLKS